MSNAQQNKLTMELGQFRTQFEATNSESETYKMKIQKLLSENTSMGEEVRNAQ